MPFRWRITAQNLAHSALDLALTVLAIGGAQILLSLLLWLAFFRAQPQGFSMALSLVGFGGWFIGFVSSIGAGRMSFRRTGPGRQAAVAHPPEDAPKAAHPLVARFQDRIERAGCGFVLFLSSLVPLALAFYLRVQADMRSGKTWSDIFPSIP